MVRFTAARLSLLTISAVALAGCAEPQPTPTKPAAAAMAPSATQPTEAEKACLKAVRDVSRNDDVRVLRSEFSQAGTFVRVGVGPERAPWKCIAHGDGSTDGVEFMGEG